MLKFSEFFEFPREKFRKIPILKEFEWFEWFEWFGPSPIEPFISVASSGRPDFSASAGGFDAPSDCFFLSSRMFNSENYVKQRLRKIQKLNDATQTYNYQDELCTKRNCLGCNNFRSSSNRSEISDFTAFLTCRKPRARLKEQRASNE